MLVWSYMIAQQNTQLQQDSFWIVQLNANTLLRIHFITRGKLVHFWARRDSIEPNSYGDVAGWVAGCLSQPVLYQND